MTEEDEKNYSDINICRFCENEYLIKEVRDHCHLNGQSKVPALNNKCYI